MEPDDELKDAIASSSLPERDWDALSASLGKLWSPEELPSPETGDDKPHAGGEMELPEMDMGKPPPMPPPEPTEPWARIKFNLEQNANRKPAMDPLAEKMAAVGWAPKEAKAAPDWEALQKGLQSAEESANATRLGQQSFQAVAPRFHADPNAGSAEIAAAKAPLDVAQERQAFEAKQHAADAALLTQRQQMAQRDPSSPESQRARNKVKALYADTGKLPPDFESYTAADVAGLMSALPAIEKNQSEETRAAAKAKEAAGAKTASLEDRKKTMLSLYPEHEKEISALNDLGDAQTLQTALEGRTGRESSQTAAEKARQETQAHGDREAAIAAARALENAKKLKEYDAAHKPPTAEQLTQLEGINKSAGALDVFEKGLHSTDTSTGKLAANFPKVAGAIGAEGADFDSLRKGTAVALARGLEGGTARPGNVEIIDSMLPEASDAPDVKAHKMANVRAFVENNRAAFMKTAQTGGTNLQAPSNTETVTVKDAQTGKTKTLPADKAKKYLDGDPKRFQVVSGG